MTNWASHRKQGDWQEILKNIICFWEYNGVSKLVCRWEWVILDSRKLMNYIFCGVFYSRISLIFLLYALWLNYTHQDS